MKISAAPDPQKAAEYYMQAANVFKDHGKIAEAGALLMLAHQNTGDEKLFEELGKVLELASEEKKTA